ncbi:hypothetical protein Pmani_019101 [Petrolisthes manimaculis]|uniref:Uncharacterized protein n=1 Tax=Petrolisthes manimaculis TaxID=1843537 RepID=A0AAE1PJL2_9EUCA|nr:hypothetical protein Pmani_019101 [Petrolisthes manimaculis]
MRSQPLLQSRQQPEKAVIQFTDEGSCCCCCLLKREHTNKQTNILSERLTNYYYYHYHYHYHYHYYYYYHYYYHYHHYYYYYNLNLVSQEK